MAGENLHEAMRAGMENRLCRRLRLDGIEAALAPEVPVSAGIETEGLIYYEDASGKTHRKPVAHWIGFMAMRLYTVAHQELSRQFNAGCRGLDEAGNRALDAKLRRELRTDALFALAFHSHMVFEAAELRRYSAEEEIAAIAPEIEADPVHGAIEAVRRCLRDCAAAQQLPQPPGRLDPLPEQETAGTALHASLDALAVTVPTTAAGCAALAQFAVEFHAAEGFAVDEDERGQQHLRILDLIARSPMNQHAPVVKDETAPQTAGPGVDPIQAVLRASWQAKAALDQFEERGKGRGLTPDRFEGERRLMEEDSRARDAVYATTPTTRHGQIALLHWLKEQIDNAGCVDGTPADGHESVWADGYRALAAALLSPPVNQGKWARVQADAVNLSGCNIKALARLFEAFSAAADRWSDLSCLPYAEEDEAIARVVDGEYERAGFVRDRILGLLRSRRPENDSERDDALSVRLRYELDCEMKVRDRALIAEINAAWGA